MAAEGDGLSIETFKPSTSINSLFELTLPRTKEHLKWSVGGLLEYEHKPVRRQRLQDGDEIDEANPVQLRLNLHLHGALGLFGWGEIGLAIPVVAYQNGEGADPNGDLQPAGLGDPRIDFKARFLELAKFSMGAGAILTLPLGNYASSGRDFLGSELPSLEPMLLGEVNLGAVFIGMNLGFLIRDSATLGDVEQTHSMTWNAGVGWDIRDYHEPGGIRLALEMNGEAGINFDDIVETPMEILLGGKYRTPQDLIIEVGGGPGMSTAVGTPIFRIFAGIYYDKVVRNCPAGPEDVDGFEDDDKCIDPDNDQDGILDTVDSCPNTPEDFDKFEDEDGCPDLDNDKDGIPDTVDSCPMVPEDADNFEDDDGCPEEGPQKSEVKITDTQILISSKIYFDFDKATIKEVSYPILDAVAEALILNPQITLVQIEGHTDNEGTEEYNQVLSEDRAKSVMEYLIGKNVEAERLTYKGFGFTKPKASNDTEEGKAINRRVEFTILKQATKSTEKPTSGEPEAEKPVKESQPKEPKAAEEPAKKPVAEQAGEDKP